MSGSVLHILWMQRDTSWHRGLLVAELFSPGIPGGRGFQRWGSESRPHTGNPKGSLLKGRLGSGFPGWRVPAQGGPYLRVGWVKRIPAGAGTRGKALFPSQIHPLLPDRSSVNRSFPIFGNGTQFPKDCWPGSNSFLSKPPQGGTSGAPAGGKQAFGPGVKVRQPGIPPG